MPVQDNMDGLYNIRSAEEGTELSREYSEILADVKDVRSALRLAAHPLPRNP